MARFAVAALYDQRLAEKDALIAELCRRAEVAEAALATAEAEKVAPAAPQPRSEASPPSAHGPPIAPAPAGGFWQRLRRVFGGE